MDDIARAAIGEAKARAKTNEAVVPEFIKVKKKGKRAGLQEIRRY